MPVWVHVRGVIEYGRLHEYIQIVEKYKGYRRSAGYVVPEVFLGLSGSMNTVIMIYWYDDSAFYEREEATTTRDKKYAEIASQMPYIQGAISYELFKEI